MAVYVKSLDWTGNRYRLYAAKHEDDEIREVTVSPLNIRGMRSVVEFEKEGDAVTVAALLLEQGAYSSVEVVKSCGIYLRKEV